MASDDIAISVRKLTKTCRTDLDVVPSSPDFSDEFMSIVGST